MMKGKEQQKHCSLIITGKNNVDIKVMRIFNTYGLRMDIGDGRVVSNFIVQALRGEDITVYGGAARHVVSAM